MTENLMPTQDDPTMANFHALVTETQQNLKRLVQRNKAKRLTPDDAVSELVETVMSLLNELTELSYRAHFEQREWAAQVDEDLDELSGDNPATQILHEDAFKIKALLLDLQRNLRAATDDDEVPKILATRTDEMVKFIDEVTVIVDPDAAEDDSEPDAEEEDEDPTTAPS